MRSPAARSRRHASSPSSVRHRDVEDDRVVARGGDALQRLAAVLGEVDLVALEVQRPVQGRADGELIVDHKDAHGHEGADR